MCGARVSSDDSGARSGVSTDCSFFAAASKRMIRQFAASSFVFIMASDVLMEFTDVCKPLSCEVIVR